MDHGPIKTLRRTVRPKAALDEVLSGRSPLAAQSRSFAESRSLAPRGYHAIYRSDQINHCPGCGRTNWLVGRISAECAFCATALPLAEIMLPARPAPGFFRSINPSLDAFAA